MYNAQRIFIVTNYENNFSRVFSTNYNNKLMPLMATDN